LKTNHLATLFYSSRKNSFLFPVLKGDSENRVGFTPNCIQGDQIGQIFTFWAIVYLALF
jgi:hypothetical protein